MNERVEVVLRGLTGLAGAAVGATVGYFSVVWLSQQGLYAIILPGPLLGLGCALVLRRSSMVAGILCGLAAVPLGILCEWRIAPFIVDRSLSYFLTHLDQLRPATMILIALGAVFAFWLGRGDNRYGRPTSVE